MCNITANQVASGHARGGRKAGAGRAHLIRYDAVRRGTGGRQILRHTVEHLYDTRTITSRHRPGTGSVQTQAGTRLIAAYSENETIGGFGQHEGKRGNRKTLPHI